MTELRSTGVSRKIAEQLPDSLTPKGRLPAETGSGGALVSARIAGLFISSSHFDVCIPNCCESLLCSFGRDYVCDVDAISLAASYPAGALGSVYLPLHKVLKMDVEGAELTVLRGTPRMLDEFKPRIHCETSGQVRSEVRQMLDTYECQSFDAVSFGGESSQKASTTTSNLVAIHRDDKRASGHGI